MKKKTCLKGMIGMMSISVILSGFPVNLFVQHESSESILESVALASDISEEVVDVPTDMEIERLAKEKIEALSLEEDVFQEDLATAFFGV